MFLIYLTSILTFCFSLCIHKFESFSSNDYQFYLPGEIFLTNFLYFLLIISLIVFFVSSIKILKDFSKTKNYNFFSSENFKLFLLSFGFLVFGSIYFSTNKLAQTSAGFKQTAQMNGQLEFVWPDGTHHYGWGEKGKKGPVTEGHLYFK